jgi:hypothetical protein
VALDGSPDGPLVRRAGVGRTAGGERAWWSVAAGRKGRRWREAIVGDGGLRHSLLLETDPDGRFSHLELAAAAGLLTLHPEGDGTLHGNALLEGGLRHVAGLPWDADGLVLVDGSPVARAAAAALLAQGAGAPPGPRLVLRITPGLELALEPVATARVGDRRWRLDGGDELVADRDGLPVLDGGQSWPLDLPG